MDEGVGFIAEKGQGQFKTAVALTSGDSVVISVLTTEESRDQVTITNVGATATRHKLIGAYQGIGGTGALNTTSGSPGGRNALAGDLVWVTMHGIAITLVTGDTTDVAVNDTLMMENGTNGTLIIAVAAASNVAGSHYGAFALEASTGTAAFKKVYFRCV
jgi:hypothetical protein